MSVEFNDRFIAYIDILGFSSLVEKIEKDKVMSMAELFDVLKKLGSKEDQEKFAKYGHLSCQSADSVRKNIDLRITQVSDCAVISCNVSETGIISLISHCWGAVVGLLTHGLMCRGYITRGSLIHTDEYLVGSGFQFAYKMEKGVSAFKTRADERGTPFVEVDNVVCDYIKLSTDKCVKEMFDRLVKSEGEVVALFPFKMLAHSYIVVGPGIIFDAVEEKNNNNQMRLLIGRCIESVNKYVDMDNSDAINKARHYVNVLTKQLQLCDRIDENIDRWDRPIPQKGYDFKK